VKSCIRNRIHIINENSGALEAQNRAVDAHNGGMEAQNGITLMKSRITYGLKEKSLIQLILLDSLLQEILHII
jgi:hypothetical protein